MKANPVAPFFGACLLAVATLAPADICVRDDRDREICLPAPAQRIVSLSPGVTELLFDAGAGDSVVGTSTFSDYPAAAQSVPRVGSYQRIDLEALLALQPDLVIAWNSGSPTAQVERLESLQIPVFWSEQENFEDVASSLERYGRLAGTIAVAGPLAEAFRDAVEDIRQRHRDAPPVEVFYQLWEDPLMTLNGDHLISHALELCGARNIFAGLKRLTPKIDVESVLDQNPEAILVGGMGESNDEWLQPWRAYPGLRAVAQGNLFFVPPSMLQRPTPRILDGIRMVCDHMDVVRARR